MQLETSDKVSYELIGLLDVVKSMHAGMADLELRIAGWSVICIGSFHGDGLLQVKKGYRST
jgi:hypothetical protein